MLCTPCFFFEREKERYNKNGAASERNKKKKTLNDTKIRGGLLPPHTHIKKSKAPGIECFAKRDSSGTNTSREAMTERERERKSQRATNES